ncbi:Ribokinase-like protein [Martensiomyces pterosporus]|nr:Ribokinase-like protein [Martensiomyces pterosporus]
MSSQRPRLQTIAQLIPPLTYDLHKGDCGRIAAIGGCEEYTGAPYFVASAALRLGADLAYVVCEKDAANVIKGYSPDLIVNPYLRSDANKADHLLDNIDKRVFPLLRNMHAVSAGSGLGNDLNMRESVRRAIKHVRELDIPIVLDANSLAIVCETPEIIHGYAKAILTPNQPEFKRLCKALGLDAGEDVAADKLAQTVASKLGGVTLVRKGKFDIITNGDRLFVCDETGGLRRCGGQGDILSGATATFLAWGERYKAGAWKHSGDIKDEDIPMLAAFAACMITRHASFLAYDECGRATQSTSVLEQVDIAFDNKFEEILKAVKPPKL